MNRQLEDILNQPRSLARVLAHQTGYGAGDLAKAAARIREARNVIFTGMGSSLFAAMPAVCILNDHGILAEAVESSELLYYRPRRIQRDTVVVLVSRSGGSIEVTKLLPLVRNAGAHGIGITNVADSVLAREVPDRLLIGHEPDQMVAIQSYTGTLVTLLLLALESLNERPTPEFLTSLTETMQATIAGEVDADWLTLLSDATVVYLLGRGPSMASVHEGALMFNEAARTPSVAMSAAQFRHGPVEVVSDRFRAIVFASDPRTLDLDRSLADDLTRLGGRVEVCSAPVDVAPFQPLIEIVPVQFAACRLAESKGIPPGEFRYAGQVTTTETGFRG